MVFGGIKKVFNRIGNLTVNSSQKVGGGVQKVGEGVQKPVKRIREVERPKISRSTTKKESKTNLSTFDSKSISKTKSASKTKSPRKVIKKMGMEKDEIEIFRDLIDQKYERKEKVEDEDKAKKAAVRKASLEELLKEEEKPGLDPKLILIIGVLSFAVVFTVIVVLGFGIEIGLVFGIIILLMTMFIVYMPKIKMGGRSTAASRELPFALRQMATELRAGIGLHDSMRSVAMSGYGPLSEEFARALEEIKYGETTEKALVDMSERINSEGLTRAIYQITRTLTSGGDLAKTLSVIADDTAYEMRMKLKDYAQKLNSFTMIYMFVAILGPVIFMIMIIAASTVMGSVVPPILLLIMYLFLFPAIVAFMAFMIKRLEPKV
ncbi:type II secretion system F family protein [Methanobacterium sp.]|uniref:type II secretion system F family protein n=1 Tax=Methanobacterium sp. TaxID=2164 RepID=UPI0025D3516A|nr:type II secretion system F family protein [Methanobacterium sp.]MBI5458873.1 type II secretion system F family protein [Methanobacterium sp.]MDY9924440.1 type II secretion system F family protein [Methanobacterium sp.]